MLHGFVCYSAALLSVEAIDPVRTETEIVVTGERVKRSLRETPSSVWVTTGSKIEATAADRVEQVLQVIPNVQLGNGSEGPAIRGQDTTGALQALPAFLGGNRPRTTLVVDGRRQTYNEFVFGTEPVWDLNRIEVFRSPQTTTEGQNSIAGAIFVYSNDPTFEPEYRARLIGGNYRTGELSALMSGPLSDDIALRLSGDLRYSRTTSRIVDRVEGANPNHDVYGVARAKLLIEPKSDAGAKFLLEYTHSQSQAPQIVNLTEPFRARRDADGFYGTFRIRVDALTGSAHQPIAKDLNADLVVTAGDSDARRLAFPGAGQSHIQGRDWSAEAVINWSPAGIVQSVGGASYSHLKLHQFMDLSLLSGLGRFRDAQDSIGLFGETNIRIARHATLTAGIRYQQDRQNRVGVLGNPPLTIPLDYDRTFHAWLPKLSFAYDLDHSVRVGVLIERAYNPGGTTVRFDTGQPDNFESEHLWDYEAFVRGKLAEGFTASANVFYYDMRNAQRAKPIVVIGPTGFPVGFADLFNAPKGHSFGAEAELDWRPSRRVSARVSLGLLRTKLVEAGPGYGEFSGNEFARSPHTTAAAELDWDVTPSLHLSAQGRYHSSYYGADLNAPNVRVDPATIINARAEYRLRRITLFAYARNLFNKFALIERFPGPPGAGRDEATAEDPRMVGVGAETRF